MENKLDLVLEIIKSIPDNLKEPSMVLKSKAKGNSQDYTEENCKKRNVPFLKIFKDIDSYINPITNSIRMQGYININSITDLNLSVEELEFILKLSKKGIWVYGKDVK